MKKVTRDREREKVRERERKRGGRTNKKLKKREFFIIGDLIFASTTTTEVCRIIIKNFS